MDGTLPGLHHVTAITADAQQNIDFYTGALGLRLVKLTVNFDDPGAYHLYYGDDLGHPGTILTFFAWPGAPRAGSGTGHVVATAYAVPADALPFWQDRLAAHGITTTGPTVRFGKSVLAFADPDGIALELIATGAADDTLAATRGGVPAAYAIRGFHGVTLALADTRRTADMLAGLLGFRRGGEEDGRTRYAASAEAPGAYADLVVQSGMPAQAAAGSVHHVAWRTPDDAAQVAWLGQLHAQGIRASPVMDRQYFHSIYFREPGGVLFEIATDPPGFTVDETPAALGTGLMLPPQYEPYRAQIAAALPPLRLPLQSVGR